MKILVIGSGGREHAIAWKCAKSPRVERVYCAPGNGGTWYEDKCVNIDIKDTLGLIEFAKAEGIDLTIIGPEVPLVDGIVDDFKARGLDVFGPSKKAAQLEGSKIYAKEFMKKYGVRSAWSETFINSDNALEYIKNCQYPIVIKADGLAAGKGVVICNTIDEAKRAVEDFMIHDIFLGSGKSIIIEEYLEGVEASILSVTDGRTILPFVSSKDHKTIYDGNKGPNTGGMGVVAPNPFCTEDVLREFEKNIMEPTLRGIAEEQMDCKGFIFFGIMITKKGPYLLEYNMRLGDPETQAVLPLMESDFVELIIAAMNSELRNYKIQWSKGASCCIVAASKGYPGSYARGFEIENWNKTPGKVFIAGAEHKDGTLKTTGGRVLSVVAKGATLEEARKCAYEDMGKISFEGIYYRKDIGE